jgi:hypothetical protein
MNILCLSFKEHLIYKRKELTQDICYQSKEKIDLLVFPGNAKYKNVSSNDNSWVKPFGLSIGANIIAEKGSAINGNNRICLYGKDINEVTSKQIFSESSEIVSNPNLGKKLINEINQGERTFNLECHKIGILICGENNILRNYQSKANLVSWRNGEPNNGWADIIINPSHNTMGNWGKLNKRFEFISKKYGWLIYLTNNSSKHSWKTSIKIFKKGKEIRNGDNPNFCSKCHEAIGCLINI